MANKYRGECEVTLAGKTYTLRPTFEALVEFEDKAGMTAYEAMEALTKHQRAPAKAIAAAIYVGIKAVEGKTAPAYGEVGSLCQRTGIVKLVPVFMEFLGNALSSEDDLRQRADAPQTKDGVQGEAKTK